MISRTHMQVRPYMPLEQKKRSLRFLTEDQLVVIHQLAIPINAAPVQLRAFGRISSVMRYRIISRLTAKTRRELVQAYRQRVFRLANDRLLAYLNK